MRGFVGTHRDRSGFAARARRAMWSAPERLGSSPSSWRPPRPDLAQALAVVGGISGMLLTGPLPTNQSDNPWNGTTSDPGAINDVLALIPDEAPLSAGWYIGPHVDHRTVVYMYPNPFVRDYWSADAAPGPPVDGAEWVALRADTPGEYAQNTLEALAIIEANPRWEQVVANDAVMLYHGTS